MLINAFLYFVPIKHSILLTYYICIFMLNAIIRISTFSSQNISRSICTYFIFSLIDSSVSIGPKINNFTVNPIFVFRKNGIKNPRYCINFILLAHLPSLPPSENWSPTWVQVLCQPFQFPVLNTSNFLRTQYHSFTFSLVICSIYICIFCFDIVIYCFSLYSHFLPLVVFCNAYPSHVSELSSFIITIPSSSS